MLFAYLIATCLCWVVRKMLLLLSPFSSYSPRPMFTGATSRLRFPHSAIDRAADRENDIILTCLQRSTKYDGATLFWNGGQGGSASGVVCISPHGHRSNGQTNPQAQRSLRKRRRVGGEVTEQSFPRSGLSEKLQV